MEDFPVYAGLASIDPLFILFVLFAFVEVQSSRRLMGSVHSCPVLQLDHT